ncbi:HAD hydrolase-like protein [Nostoc sp. LEGE 12447]|uniref:HAD hydrolase-like protein n=1 Tax=Nostoc sp. LEGE 12447 TaxID=1828640 RepID=UPI00188429E5|nr:HAD hydrolase-like protein [Nostoc sp. LEGE 12447]
MDLPNCWFIGDNLSDLEAEHSAGSKTILIAQGNQSQIQVSRLGIADYILVILSIAAQVIITAS